MDHAEQGAGIFSVASLPDESGEPPEHDIVILDRAITMPLAAIFALLICADASTQDTRARPAVGQIDHIMIRTGSPQTVFALFAETFRLPVAWPLATRGGVTSGGVSFGNVNVEAIAFPRQMSDELALVGFAFEPSASLSDSLTEFDRRGIAYGEPRPFVVTKPDGSRSMLWTNVTLAALSDSDRPVDARMHIFLGEYSPDYVDVEHRRVRLRKVLSDGGGGPLGVERVVEVTIGTTNLEVSEGLWAELLAPRKALTKGHWKVGSGPAVRLVRAAENKLQGLVIAVRSLERAEGFLREKGLLGTVSDGLLTLDAAKVEGIGIRLVEEN
jgi:hypothetical protein